MSKKRAIDEKGDNIVFPPSNYLKKNLKGKS